MTKRFSKKVSAAQQHAMRLFSVIGERLCLTEREQFRIAANPPPSEQRLLRHFLRDSGVMLFEAWEVSALRLGCHQSTVLTRTLKQKVDPDGAGRAKYRHILLSIDLLDSINDVFPVRQRRARGKGAALLRDMHRTTDWRIVKRVMHEARLDGARTSPNGLRHDFGIACVLAEPTVPNPLVKHWLGHAKLDTTAIYLRVMGDEERQFADGVWS